MTASRSAAHEPRHRSPEGAEARRHNRHGHGDLERALAAHHESAENVETVGVGAERMSGARRQVGERDVRVQLIAVVDEWAQEAEEDDGHDDAGADHAQTVLEIGPEESMGAHGLLTAASDWIRPGSGRSSPTGTNISAITDPRVEHRVGEVGEQAPEHGRHADDDGNTELKGVVRVHRRIEVGEAKAGEVEQVLDDEPGGEDGRDRQARGG